MRRIGSRAMTSAERVAKHRSAQFNEIRQLRRTLLNALEEMDVEKHATFYLLHADVIERAYITEKEE